VRTDLQEDIRAVASQIDEAAKEAAQYSGGLIRSLLLLRIEILKTTQTLLEQRALADNYNVTLTYKVGGDFRPPEPAADDLLRQLDAEISRQQQKLGDAQRESQKYRGGLVQAMHLSTAATIGNTVAMLEQRRVLAKWGIPYPTMRDGETAPASQPPPVAGSGTQTIPPSGSVASGPPPKRLEIVNVDARVTELNNTWWRYAWRLTLRNDTDTPMRAEATIEFQDKDGFVIDEAREHNAVVPAREEKTFTGYTLIRSAVAPNVARLNAKLRAR
jgi:hypothetical protein